MATSTGCNRAVKHQLTAIARFDQGMPLQAMAAFDTAAKSRGAEQEIIAADRAIAALMSGEPRLSEAPLRETRQRMNFLRQTDVREKATAVITDDQAIAWSGREFEQRMIDNLLILSSLMGNRQDAFAYATQAMEHVFEDRSLLTKTVNSTPVNEPRDNTTPQPIALAGHSADSERPPSPKYSPNALSAYLHAAIRSENPMDSDVAKNAIRQVSYWNQSSKPNVVSTDFEGGFGTMSPRGQGVVHVMTFVGRVTDWVPERSMPTTGALLIADQILSATGKHSLPPTVAPVLIARPTSEFSAQPLFTRARVVGAPPDSSVTGTTLIDLNHAAFDSYVSNREQQIARAVVRRVVKKAAIYATKDQLAITGDSGADLLLNLGGIAWEAMEKADTRHLQLLPERIETLQLTLPAGQHEVDIWPAQQAESASATNRTAIRVPVIVEDGRNTFVLCFRPHGALAGSILTSDGSPPLRLQ